MALFDVHIWGTVGQWVSALVTGGAFGTTLLIIRRDRRATTRQQASLIGAHVELQSPNFDSTSGKWIHSFRIPVTNYSPSQISMVFGVPEPVSYRRYRYERLRIRAEFNQDPNQYAPEYPKYEWNSAEGPDGVRRNPLDQDPFRAQHLTLKPQESITFVHQGYLSQDFVSLIIHFRDARLRRWRLDAMTGVLREDRKTYKQQLAVHYRVWKLALQSLRSRQG
ncbi:Uncharacterised protein [Mycobacteroides abscessus subsp. bolletii]|uniref:hypothetical protein n=1 Tax=Mycobacteroides abscessus TaxID=36809 RepID=UPI0009265185|nr:hypothetical protein [Mycobacteroides abscessus]SHY89054.1 Uncharacterised protein [Mycobacteroides abscessus subsp. bolletii]SHZ09302.1 Uncharacterised protein [Mycobacteroides abscessus subsp. bolletii]